ncbi:hypothetical protein CJ195_15250 [Bacillus sp. UMB0899]|uniref:DUF2085 domain-containing protein n=1 Tax=Metabacillus schmidteae TaxID=2730405 RepID=UPI000C80D4AF|nr:DUF2085 domain-containing protein [Metabacillus schmidteae]PMC36779.1 hypothetical protein CJ195_15250 [Bacillus sp. UMB0899]
MSEILNLIPCHRIPERCIHFNGKPMNLCTRCFAMLLGYMCTPIALAINIVVPFWISIIMAIPLLIDGFTQRWGWRQSSNSIRFITGILFGIGQSILISTIVWTIVNFVN